MRCLSYLLAGTGSLLLHTALVHAQFTTVLNLPPDALPFPIGSNTQVNVFDGGLIPSSSQSGAVDGSSSNIEINVFGGMVEQGLSLYAGSTLNATGGLVGTGLEAFSGSTVNVDGGRILAGFLARSGSSVNLSSGTIDPGFRARDGSSVFVTGGSIGPDFRIENGGDVILSSGLLESAVVQPGGSMTMTGGDARLVVQGSLLLSGGTVRQNFDTGVNGQVRILGGEYRLNGTLIPELQDIGDTLIQSVQAGAVLSGTLADGTPFAFSSWADDNIATNNLTLETVALPAVGPAVILAPSDPVPRGIRAGQQLVVDDGATVPSYFNAGWDSNVEVQAGGTLGNGFEAVHAHVNIAGGTTGTMNVYSQSTVTISPGSNVGAIIADGGSVIEVEGGTTSFVDVVGGSIINMHGGALASGLNIHSGATANIFDGNTGSTLRPLAGSTLNVHGGTLSTGIFSRGDVTITGGSIGDRFEAAPGSTAHISGGTLGDNFRAQTGSVVTFSGGDFRINGVPIPGLGPVGSSMPVNVPAGAVLSGVLADGTPFAFSTTDGDVLSEGSLNLETANLPPITDATLTVPGDDPGRGIRGQSLTILAGGTVGSNFSVGPASKLTLHHGGSIGRNLEVVGAELNILGGSVGEGLDAFAGATVNIKGGTVGNRLDAHPGSTLNISAGIIGSLLQAFDDSVINVYGTEFFLDGVPITGLSSGVPFELLARAGTLSGVLSDGSPFSFPLRDGGRLTSQLISLNATVNLIAVPEPAAVALLLTFMLGNVTRPVVSRRPRAADQRNSRAGDVRLFRSSAGSVDPGKLRP